MNDPVTGMQGFNYIHWLAVAQIQSRVCLSAFKNIGKIVHLVSSLGSSLAPYIDAKLLCILNNAVESMPFVSLPVHKFSHRASAENNSLINKSLDRY